MDIDKMIHTAMTTGEVYFGMAQAKKLVAKNECKMLIVASNCPELEFAKEQKDVFVYRYGRTNIELGRACGKPFAVSVIAIKNPGTSNILVLKEPDVIIP